jgi:hypothetical protein
LKDWTSWFDSPIVTSFPLVFDEFRGKRSMLLWREVVMVVAPLNSAAVATATRTLCRSFWTQMGMCLADSRPVKVPMPGTMIWTAIMSSSELWN